MSDGRDVREVSTSALGRARAFDDDASPRQRTPIVLIGFSIVEAMACGTPVVAFRRGSMPELIDHGTTGLLVDDMDQAIEAVALAGKLDRPQIRERAVTIRS